MLPLRFISTAVVGDGHSCSLPIGRYLACDCSFGSLVTPEVSLVTPVVSVVLSVGSPLSFDVVSTVRAVLFCVSCC